MPKLTVDGKEIEVEDGATVLQACEEAGAEIPRFCYHERLSIAGNCRMCLVEMENSPKPVASCALPAGDGMVIRTNSEKTKKAREGVMEFLLINHPLDCPICDQGGECDLQDQAMAYGSGLSRYQENKRAVKEKHMGPLIKTIMTRCIHCTRCVRFADEVAGVPELGAVGRGEDMEITTYIEKTLQSELSGNVIDLCPVGALTSKPYAFVARSWELRKTETVDVMDAVGSNIRIDARGNEVMRALPRNHDAVNEEWISDKTRFAVDGLKFRRLDRPWVRKRGKLKEATWKEALAAIKKGLKGLKGDQIAGIVGDLQDMESMYAFRGLLKGLGSKRIEARQDGAKLDASCRAGYLFNTGIAGVMDADACLLLGCNPRAEAPIINAWLRKAVIHNGLTVGRIGAEADLTYALEQIGTGKDALKSLLDGKGGFARVLRNANRPMIIVGQGALAGKDGAAVLGAARRLAEKYGMVMDGWNGFNVLHTAAARVGALDLGLVADGGIDAIGEDAKSGGLKAVFNLGADEVDSSAFADCFTVYIGTHGDEGVKAADVILPAAAYTEKYGIYINTEGRVQQGLRAAFPPGDAREDWAIFRALSDVLGNKLPYDSLRELRAALAGELAHIAQIDVLPEADWGEFGKEGALSTEVYLTTVPDFFLSNSVARASKTMAECHEARVMPEKATGTYD